MRLSSFTTKGPTHTGKGAMSQAETGQRCPLTFFADETVVPVVGVICISQTTMRVFEFKEFMSVFT